MADFFRHCEYVKDCFLRQEVPEEMPASFKLIDHRFFYDEFKPGEGFCGNYTCGLVRDAVATKLMRISPTRTSWRHQ
jgi:hypothetical protein